ncbi:alpha/beta fold hydrolase [Winogradskyella flava]|nr:alpha/beta hydrolase [Winogradskyella flava]
MKSIFVAMILEYKHIDVHFTTTGKGKAIVLLHGFLENVDMWNDLAPELGKRYQVVCIDLLGHGRTGCIGYVHTMDDMADAVLAVLKHLNITRVKCIGHSMGGYAALALAEKQPELFSGLCLMNSTFEADDIEKHLIRTRAIEMAKVDYKSLICLSFSNLFAPESKERFTKAYDHALQLALQTSVQGYIAAQEGMKLRPDRLHVFKHLKGQKLILIGKKDTLVDSKKTIEKINTTNIEYLELPSGHMSHIENKSELPYIISRFVEK